MKNKIFICLVLLISTSVMATDTNTTISAEINSTKTKETKKEVLEIKWAKDYKTGIAEAKKTSKPIFFVISRDTCKYCVILKKTTFKDPKVIKALNKDFVSIIAQTDENDYVPRALYAPGLPAMWFLYSDARPMYQPLMGMMKSKDFLQALATVKTEFDANNKKGSK